MTTPTTAVVIVDGVNKGVKVRPPGIHSLVARWRGTSHTDASRR
jgi:hypothetical protein